ncbi:hypothetical protein GFV14_00504 [Candidatus Hartigia pinicola]|nr:hypothetical protein GFV14_00504 [Candidatus Hartigia pinicola]
MRYIEDPLSREGLIFLKNSHSVFFTRYLQYLQEVFIYFALLKIFIHKVVETVIKTFLTKLSLYSIFDKV